MLHELIKRHPNSAKFVLCNEAFFFMRYKLTKKIVNLQNMINNTDLQDDVYLKRQLGSLKRALNGLTERQENICSVDEKQCAQILLEFENELYPNLLDACRFYKGETDNPFENIDNTKASFWWYESCWVRFKQDLSHYDHLQNDVAEFIYYGLMSFDENTPISLKATLWNRYCHWGNHAAPEDFMNWYLKTYIQ